MYKICLFLLTYIISSYSCLTHVKEFTPTKLGHAYNVVWRAYCFFFISRSTPYSSLGTIIPLQLCRGFFSLEYLILYHNILVHDVTFEINVKSVFIVKGTWLIPKHWIDTKGYVDNLLDDSDYPRDVAPIWMIGSCREISCSVRTWTEPQSL